MADYCRQGNYLETWSLHLTCQFYSSPGQYIPWAMGKTRGHSKEMTEPLRLAGDARGVFKRMGLAFSSASHNVSSSYTARVL